MKKSLIIVLAALVVGLIGCVKDLDKEGFAERTVLKGKVIEETEHVPVSGINVSVTNGSRTYSSYTTGADGQFELEVNFYEIDNDYYLLLDGKGKSKKYDLKGMGNELYDYRDLVLYAAIHLATFEYDGIVFDVYPTDINNKNWDQAHEYCEELVYADYDDWALPSKEELLAMYENKGSIGGFGSNKYWSGTYSYTFSWYDIYNIYYHAVDFGTGDCIDENKKHSLSFRPIRISTSGAVMKDEPTITTIAPSLSETIVTTSSNLAKENGEAIIAKNFYYSN